MGAQDAEERCAPSRALSRHESYIEDLATLRREVEARERAEENASVAALRRDLDSWSAPPSHEDGATGK